VQPSAPCISVSSGLASPALEAVAWYPLTCRRRGPSTPLRTVPPPSPSASPLRPRAVVRMASPTTPPRRTISTVWDYMVTNAGRMSCRAANCAWGDVVRNATRAKVHLLRCVWALELFPEMPTRLRSAPNRQSPSSSPGRDLVLPSLSREIFARWRSQFARVQLQAGLKFSRVSTRLSGGRSSSSCPGVVLTVPAGAAS